MIILDSVGVGYLPDAEGYGDTGANTLGNIFNYRGYLNIPNLCKLGLGNIVDIGCRNKQSTGNFGRMKEVSKGKDTTSGHWEITGVKLDFEFPVYPKGFPKEIVSEFSKAIGTEILGNYPESGTVIIERLGEEHLKTGYPIVYTSADSVFQIAAHKKIVPVEKLYKWCRTARKILSGRHSVGRVIARPFYGEKGNFKRDNSARKDFSLPPPCETLLDKLKQNNKFVIGIGKIGDLFAHQGLTQEIKTSNNEDGINKILDASGKTENQEGIIIANLVDFDSVYGHRRDVDGYARALEEFDLRLPEIIDSLNDNDILIITADHGCDPTYVRHTDHTREYVPLIIYGRAIKKGINLGIRDTFSDCGQTIADFMRVEKLEFGKSFKNDIKLNN